jgi:hypothetical protein
LLLIRMKCGFTDEEIARVERDSIEMCWASELVKRDLLEEIKQFCASRT